MPRFLVHHRHLARECGIAYSSFKGHESPLRHTAALSSCPCGEHSIWWTVEAATDADALAMLPFFIAQRSAAIAVTEVQIP